MKSIMDRFWKNVRKTDGCWEWTGSTKKSTGDKAYGHFIVYAHRVSYEHHKGPIESGKHIHHVCNNPLCVNPAHLEMVTPKENNHYHFRAITHCPHGHEYDEENTVWYRGKRLCRACRRRYSAENAVRKKAERHARGLRGRDPKEKIVIDTPEGMCPEGHPLDGMRFNMGKWRRYCKTCNREAQRRSRARKKADVSEETG